VHRYFRQSEQIATGIKIALTIRAVAEGCRCRFKDVPKKFCRKRIKTFKVDGIVRITCEFCIRERVFDDGDLNVLYVSKWSDAVRPTVARF